MEERRRALQKAKPSAEAGSGNKELSGGAPRIWRAAFRHDIILTYSTFRCREVPCAQCRARSRQARLNIMPGDPKECRQHGLRCTELAEQATDPELKAVLKSLAKRWVQLAAELDLAQALRDQGERRPKMK
jgi:hypothetical protein